jgi:glycosyltransferase involved in cell wall biosynthesis
VRLVVQDFSGHPFQAQLSRALAARGHEVVHTSCSGYMSGRGALALRDGDPATLRFEDVGLSEGFDKYRYRRRIVQELTYAVRLVRLLRRHRPEVFVSCNEPLIAKAVVGTWCWVTRQRWVFWLQDLYSVAMRREMTRALGRVGDLIGRGFEAIERFLLRRADGVVVISPAFDDWLAGHGIRRPDLAMIPNWAPLDEVHYFADDQGWFERIGIPAGAPVVLYSGTLGHKHDAGMFEVLAERLGAAHVVVISEGPAADQLAEVALKLANLHVLPFQAWEDLPEILASATVLVAILAPAAAQYSVPSKVLTYLCAGRPIVGSMSPDNLAAEYIVGAGAGTVTAPDDIDGFVDAIGAFVDDPEAAEHAGRQARDFAERTFDIDAIADRFEQVVADASGGRRP